jgi:PhnB protein
MLVQSYLFFNGRCEEALEFYRRAIGAETTMMMRFKDSPEPPPPGCAPSSDKKIMHAIFKVGDTEIMASDGQATGKPKFDGFSLSLTLPNAAEAEKKFKALSDGGNVVMPLGKTFFSPCFGMVADRFGVNWMVIVH